MNTNKYYQILYAILISFIITACGGGGGGGGDEPASPGDEAPALSDSLALSGQLISVTHSSIQEDDIVDVTFQTEETQATTVISVKAQATTIIPVKGIAHTNGAVDVATPTFFDADGMPITRDVRVLINGIPSASLLRIEGLPELPVATGGAVLEAFLSVAIDHYANALDNLDTIATQLGGAVDPTDAQVAIEAQLQDLEDQLFELEVLGTHSVVIEGVTTALTQQQLQLLDRWLLYTLVSIDAATDLASGNVLVAAQHQPDTIEYLKDAWERAVAALEQEAAGPGGVRQGTRDFVTQGIPDVLNTARETFKTTSTYLLGYVSLVTAGAGAFGDKALGIASSAQNMAIAQYSAFTSTINGYWSDENSDSFLNDDRDGFNLGQELLSQAVRLGTAYLGGRQDKLGNLSSNVNTALTVKDLLSEAKVDLCQTLGSPSFLCSSGEEPTATFMIQAYKNFDGTIKNAPGGSDGVGLDPQEADIRLSGNPAFPTFSWPGDGIGLTVIDPFSVELLYAVISATDPDTNDLIPFSSPVHYGDYSIPNIETSDVAPPSAPALQAQQFYEVNIQRSDFNTASLVFRLN